MGDPDIRNRLNGTKYGFCGSRETGSRKQITPYFLDVK
jgi:hypothetical protein